ncbi:response regulator [Flocculibacter collagenilyticus]|uniref:response regulator n=1 Tax=Flocculibacter collagenilyticus TaxID=2744479 RepID=UPI0018F654C3|nr:response regulator [Flocculibacter collagenilyticus]
MTVSFASDINILIIDDQPLAQSYMRYSLESLGYRNVAIAEKAERAIRLSRERNFDLMICSFNLRHGKDGYQLYEELKSKKLIKLTTAFVFISAETDTSLVHSVVELQPDDFLAKPFTLKELGSRLDRVLNRKHILRPIYQFIDSENYSAAIRQIDDFLENETYAKLLPLLLRLKGDILLRIFDWPSAITFFESILEVQKFAWARIGLVEALVNNQEDERAMLHLKQMIERPETKLIAYDMLSQLQFKNKEYEEAFNHLQIAAQMSPRNLYRQEKLLNLSRITHDYEAQFKTSKDIVKFAKHSMHEQPSIYLNVARASIDYAQTCFEEDTVRILRHATDYLAEMKKNFPNADTEEQITCLTARLLYLKDEKVKAKQLIHQVMNQDEAPIESIEDELDKAKALHELGFHDKSKQLFERIEEYCLSTQTGSNGLTEYIQQEKQQREEITETPKELNNKAVNLYSHGKYNEAFNAFLLAFKVMPKNTSICLNLLQTICDAPNINVNAEDVHHLIERCINVIDDVGLNDEQTLRYNKLTERLKDKANIPFSSINVTV